MFIRALFVALEAYLLGSIPFGYLLYRARSGGKDIRAVGSGNIGATNVMRVAGPRLGVLTLLLDAAKGFAAVLIADYLSYQTVQQPYIFMKTGFNVPQHHYGWLSIAIVLVLAGHIFTPWLRCRGGKGVATALGVFLLIAPKALAAAAVLFLVVLAVSRYVSLSSMLSAIAFPLLLWWLYRGDYPGSIMIATCIGSLLILSRHTANLQRLRAGTENRVGRPRPAPLSRA